MKYTIKVTSAAVIASAAFAGTAFAGNLNDAVIETPVMAPAPAPVNLGGDWTGFYTGLQLGYGDASGDGALSGADGDNGIYGFHAGYDYDFGRFVLGGEIDYDKTDIDLQGTATATIDSVARAKIKGGYDLGNTLVYATGGYARADTSLGDADGAFYGIGMTYKVTEQYTVGAELLQHSFSDVGGIPNGDVDATTFTLRGSYRF